MPTIEYNSYMIDYPPDSDEVDEIDNLENWLGYFDEYALEQD